MFMLNFYMLLDSYTNLKYIHVIHVANGCDLHIKYSAFVTQSKIGFQSK